MAIDLSGLSPKREDGGTSNAGVLTPSDWNTLVAAVEENQTDLSSTVKGINYNGTTYNEVVNGILQMTVADASGRNVEIRAIEFPNPENGTHYITPNDPCIIEFVVEDYEVKDGKEVPYNRAGEVKYYINGSLVHTQPNVFAFESQNYTGPISFDFSKYNKLTTSTYGNELIIEYTNNGIVKEYACYVYVLDIKLNVTNVNSIYTTKNLQNIKYTLSGYQNYLIYAKIDDTFILEGKECNAEIDEYINGEDNNVKLCNTHGVHVMKIWAEVLIPNSEYKLSTPVQEFTYIFGDVNSSIPVVMTNLLSGSTYEVYNNLNIEYYVYLSNANTTKKLNISLFSTDETPNKLLFESNQDINFSGDAYNGVYTLSLFPTSEVNESDIIGSAKISLGIDDNDPFEVPISIKSSSIPLTQEKNYYAYFTAQGRNNNEGANTLKVWESKHSSNPNIVTTVTFDESIKFNPDGIGSGWKVDNEGNTAMHLSRGDYFTVNYKPFENNPVYKNDNYGTGQGLTISIEFATRNCLNANAKVIECLNDNVGFYVTAGNAYLTSATTNLSTSFREDTRIKLDIVLEDKLRNYKYSSAVGKGGQIQNYDQNQSYAIMFVDGVYSGVSLIQPNTTFKQEEPQYIKFGSNDCDLDVYSIRIYEKTLSVKNIVDNYAYDTPNVAQKIEIAKRNLGILSEDNSYPFMPKINIDTTRLSNGVDGGLKVARPELPIFYVTLDSSSNDILPNTKDGDGIKSFTQFVNPLHNNPSNNSEAMCSFEVKESGFKNQGTSSMNYPWPWRNFDWKLLGDKTFYMPTTNSSITGSKWYQFPYLLKNDKLAIKKITLKKDYASSEMCNNAVTSEYFTDMALGIYSNYIGESADSKTKHSYNPGVLSPAMYDDITLNNHTDLRLALKSLPCFCVQKLNEGHTDESIKPNTTDNNFAIGMMNLIPNKNEVGYLGFKSNKWEDDVETREQSWELSENYEHIYWVKPFNYLYKNDDGKYVSDLDGYYEARTPKDSVAINSDFGLLKDNTISYEEAEKLRDEQKDIIDFHNWAVSVDRGGATGEVLKTPQYGHTHDTAEYRLDKFKAEAEQRLLIDQWILYYIWREQFWMYDSGFKNLQVYTVGPNPKYADTGIMQWGCMVRDADTALGIQNVGEIVFPPHLEDIDYGVQEGNDEDGAWTFYYNGAKNVYSVEQLRKINPNAKSVLNGQFGSLWLNIRDSYAGEIQTMYNKLAESSTLKFNANNVINKFRKHQENWSESLYNFGLRQYIGGELFTSNLKAACGDKKHSRAQWLERGFYYRASKYKALGDDKFSMRAATYKTTTDEEALRGETIRVKTYIPMYIGMGGAGSDNNSVASHMRIVEKDTDGNYYRDIAITEDANGEGFKYSSSADSNNYIFGISMITDLDDLARYIKVTNIQDLKNAPKLRKLQFGHEPERDGITYYEMVTDEETKVETKKALSNSLLNQSLSLNVCPQLELLDFTNHRLLSGLNIDKCTQLKELYLRGTDSLTSLVLPKTTLLKKLYLSNKLTTLDLSGLSGIDTLVVDGLTNCTQLIISNSGDYISSKDVSYNMLLQVINNSGLNKLKLEGINWDFIDNNDTSMVISALNKILELRKQYGRENISIKGTITGLKGIAGDLKVKLSDPINGFGNIDDPNNSLYITYTPVVISSVSIPNNIYIFNEGDNQLVFNTNPIGANTYSHAEWIMTGGSKYGTINKSTGVFTRNNEPASENNTSDFAKLKVKVYQVDDQYGNKRDVIESNEATVYFFERHAKPGDIVYHDGTFSDEIDINKTAVGVCFYVDPKDKTRRLMVALNDIKDRCKWGVGTGSYSDKSGSPQFDTTNTEFKNMNEVMNIPEIKELNDHGGIINGEYQKINDDMYRTNDPNNDNFKTFIFNSCMGNIGWTKATSNIVIDGKTVIEKDKEYPVGYINTMAMIQRRNKLAEIFPGLKITNSNANTSEYFDLPNYFNEANNTVKINEWTKNNETYMYPAASLAYAYQPGYERSEIKINNLSDKFKYYNWFVPSAGDIIRIIYYMRQYNKDSEYSDANAFNTAIKNNILQTNWNSFGYIVSSSEYYTTSTYNGGTYAAVLSQGESLLAGYGVCMPKDKYESEDNYTRLRPICMF